MQRYIAYQIIFFLIDFVCLAAVANEVSINWMFAFFLYGLFTYYQAGFMLDVLREARQNDE